MPRRLAWNSIRWRAAFVTSALVAVALASFIAYALHLVSTDVRRTGFQRTEVAGALLATSTGQNSQQALRRLQDIAASPPIRTFLESPTAAAREKARAVLDRLSSGGRVPVAVELWDGHGQVALTTTASDGGAIPTTSGAAAPQPGVGPLLERGGRVFVRVVAVVNGPDDQQILGYLVTDRPVDSAASSALVTGMVGQNARVFIGNRTGDVWTDLKRAVALPGVDLSTTQAREFTGLGGEQMMGAPLAIPNTSLVMLLALPSGEVMAPVWRLFHTLTLASLLVTFLATLAAAFLSARVTRPLDELTGAAQAIAAGDYAQRVSTTGRDEVARLGEAFNAMVHQVEQSRADLEARAHELSASREDARRANEAKDEFLAVLSHELRTPLNAMLGWCQLLRLGALPPGEMTRALDVINRNARAQLRLVDDLLDVSRIVVGRFSLEFRSVDVRAVVEAAVESILPAASEKGVTVNATLPATAGPLRGDAGRLQQAVGNLLSNALKFTPAGGRIDVSLRAANGFDIVVSDTGEGIAADVLPSIFDRLQQGNGHASRRYSGLGLGLAIVRQIVERHAGTVTANSAGAGAGSTFQIWLPDSSADDPALPVNEAPALAAADAASPAISVRGLRCLVVDDSKDARDVMIALLTSNGASVTAVESAAAALDALDRDTPDIIVSDLAMPDVSGLDLIGRVRARPAGRGGRIPAVALTAYAAPEDRVRSIEAGFDEHLAKPVNAAELIRIIARLRPSPNPPTSSRARP